ncbi:hypothetical protein BcepF1.061 [Burkholderia phage BcepF1]|uniref:Uncharacterized protein n=1 Tax=Burkholderia phage BcepF1 TaxID=2886897 RepID=A1YZW5_9CAUD|nr:hypothetical protein BcepF1.061 [Burkholderia phage BcepF1]ABL96792.1 hypothetical protein BcepF1.061 [Burkholderia phage BcepF1]
MTPRDASDCIRLSEFRGDWIASVWKIMKIGEVSLCVRRARRVTNVAEPYWTRVCGPSPRH